MVASATWAGPRAITVGGSGRNAIEGPERGEVFIDSVDRFAGLARDHDDPGMVHLMMHGFSANLEKTARSSPRANPGRRMFF